MRRRLRFTSTEEEEFTFPAVLLIKPFIKCISPNRAANCPEIYSITLFKH
jgi:hypothetical protein